MPAVICRSIMPAGARLPVTQSLRREQALFAGCEWSWTEDADEAYVFPDRNAADALIAEHRKLKADTGTGLFEDGGELLWPVTRQSGAEAAARNEAQRLEQAMAGMRTGKGERRAVRKRGGISSVLDRMEKEHPHEEVYAQTRHRLGERD